jgi:dihydrofolate reductase
MPRSAACRRPPWVSPPPGSLPLPAHGVAAAKGTVMRKIVFMMSVSLDGFFEGPDHDLRWQLISEELHHHFNEWLATAGAFLDGRVTHELMASYWPAADQDPSASAPVIEFARIWRDMPKLVFSTTLEQAGWHTTIVRELVPERIRDLKAQPGGDLVIGGAGLAAAFLAHDLIDEFRIYVHPVLLGRGRLLFEPSDTKLSLRLAETRPFANGVVLLRYERPAP